MSYGWLVLSTASYNPVILGIERMVCPYLFCEATLDQISEVKVI